MSMPLEELYPKNPRYPVLYLLHGMYEDETIWLRRSNVERYAQEHGIAVVMPRGENNYYTDMAHGLKFFTFLTQELPRFVRMSFPVSGDRRDTFIAGLSMGGYGAVKAALTNPEQYSAAISLSGAVDAPFLATIARQQGMEKAVENVFGSGQVENGPDDLFYLARRTAGEKKPLPRIYLACGREDTYCYPMNQKLRDLLHELEYPMVWQEGPGGHEWDFWDGEIRRAMTWLSENKEKSCY